MLQRKMSGRGTRGPALGAARARRVLRRWHLGRDPKRVGEGALATSKEIAEGTAGAKKREVGACLVRPRCSQRAGTAGAGQQRVRRQESQAER